MVGRELDHPEHQRDPGGIVDAGLALEGRAGAAGDLAPAEHREHHRRIGRRECGADDARQRPAEPERVVREDGQEAGGRKRPEHAQREDRAGRRTESPPADVDAAVEQDHDQRDNRDPLHGQDRHRLVHLRPEIRDDRRRDQEDRRRRHGDPSAQRRRDDRERDAAGSEEKDGCEVRNLGHGDATPTRLPGTPR